MTITNLIADFLQTLKTLKIEEIMEEKYISDPLNTKKAILDEISKSEEKLNCSIPADLKNYYLNETNGTETDIEKYAIDLGYLNSLDIFSHQKIMGIYDYFKLYWRNMDMEIDEIVEHLSEDEISFIEKNNKEFFVCIVNWTENFLETFAFDKEGNFYRFNFDQDEIIDVYIKEMISGEIEKKESLIELLKDYLEEVKEEIKEDLE